MAMPRHHACMHAGVEMKAAACAILRHRVALAGLPNVSVFCGMIEHYAQPFDVALALHACGNATDAVLLAAAHHRAAYVVSPCCVGERLASPAMPPVLWRLAVVCTFLHSFPFTLHSFPFLLRRRPRAANMNTDARLHACRQAQVFPSRRQLVWLAAAPAVQVRLVPASQG